MFRQAARQKINAFCLPDFPDYGENRFDAQLFDGLGYFGQAFVENLIDGNIILVDTRLLGDEIAQFRKTGNTAFFYRAADGCRRGIGGFRHIADGHGRNFLRIHIDKANDLLLGFGQMFMKIVVNFN